MSGLERHHGKARALVATVRMPFVGNVSDRGLQTSGLPFDGWG